MATADISGLFGGVLTPEEQQRQLTESRATQFAQLAPSQQLAFMGYKAGAGLGQGLAQAAGVYIQDPSIKRATMLRQMASGIDVTTTKGLEEFASRLQQNGFSGEAAQLGQTITARKQQEAQASLTAAKTSKELQAFDREDQLRKALGELGPDATEKEIMAVVSRYGDPSKVLQALQLSQDKKAQREMTQEEKAKQREHELERDRLRAQDRADLAALVASLKNNQNKPLSATEIKDINKINANIRSTTSTIDQADDFINKIDKGEMKFGAGENALGVVRKVLGKSNTSDLNKVEFEQFVSGAVNSILNLAKGAQTEGDAKRAEKQIIEGLNKNDEKAVKRGLQGLKKILEDAKDSDMQSLELYSAERGGKNLTANAPTAPKTPKATRRFNPATGQFEAI